MIGNDVQRMFNGKVVRNGLYRRSKGQTLNKRRSGGEHLGICTVNIHSCLAGGRHICVGARHADTLDRIHDHFKVGSFPGKIQRRIILRPRRHHQALARMRQ
ncbi:hypothetical protein SDC9_137402 [bioreactor metagenome]|uniref:Uncharacterized protein n=1 Tax=bioreactor metagenome TaxID=1076179 RepID=A0A645DM14_9ZZZZ